MSKLSGLLTSTILIVACGPEPEELRGPQGTVFGGTSTGQAINEISDGGPRLTVSPQDMATLTQYVGIVEEHIQQNWMPPVSAITEPECAISVRVTRSGEVTEAIVRTDRCFGDQSIQTAIIDSVVRSSPLPAPPELWATGSALELMVRAGPRLELLVPDWDRTHYRCDRDTGLCG